MPRVQGKILGMCNPLLDISVPVDAAFLASHNLQPGNAILARPEDDALFPELQAHPEVTYVAGGAGLNSMRVAAWMLGGDVKVGYVGSVGQDANADVLVARAEASGVEMLVSRTAEAPTGTCACCIAGRERSLVAKLAAANLFPESHMHTPAVQAALAEVAVLYVTGFFLTVCPAAAMIAAKATAGHGGKVVVNVSAPFIAEFFGEPLKALLEYADVVVCNETEAETCAKVFGVTLQDGDVEAVAQHLAALPKATAGGRRVIITQGSRPTVLVADGTATRHAVPAVPAEKIIDTNGAGDAFVGGLLSELVRGAQYGEAIQAGHYAAGEVIQQNGCQYPPRPAAPYGARPRGATVGRAAPLFDTGALLADGSIGRARLFDTRGKYSLLVFYPRDFSFVCPTEVTALVDAHAQFAARNCEVFVCSPDSAFVHLNWARTPRAERGLGGNPPFVMLEDLDGSIARAYGVEGAAPGSVVRGTFLIAPDGVVRHLVIQDPPAGRSVDEMLRVLDAFIYTDKNGEVCPANWRPGQPAITTDSASVGAYLTGGK